MNTLPNELIELILTYATESFNSTVQVSHRFNILSRRINLSPRLINISSDDFPRYWVPQMISPPKRLTRWRNRWITVVTLEINNAYTDL